MSSRKRILLVEDDPGVCHMLGMVLKINDFDVVPFTDPKLALADFNRGSFDLLLLDTDMPKMNGFELYKNMREIDRDVKVCFMTDYGREGMEEYMESLQELSHAAFVDKPILGSHLVKLLEQLIAK